jgi:hypothetical protein
LNPFADFLTHRLGVEGPVLLTERGSGGWTIYHNGSRDMRIAADLIVELLLPVERVVSGRGIVAGVGPFTPPNGIAEYILVARSGAVFPQSIADCSLVAVDLSAVEATSLPVVFHGCLGRHSCGYRWVWRSFPKVVSKGAFPW